MTILNLGGARTMDMPPYSDTNKTMLLRITADDHHRETS